MFWIGALPIITLLPLAYFRMPESVAWLAARGRMEEARAIAERTGVDIPEPEQPAAQKHELAPGESDYTGPNVEHWHGATTQSHLVQVNVGFGGGTRWLEAVPDADYRK